MLNPIFSIADVVWCDSCNVENGTRSYGLAPSLSSPVGIGPDASRVTREEEAVAVPGSVSSAVAGAEMEAAGCPADVDERLRFLTEPEASIAADAGAMFADCSV